MKKFIININIRTYKRVCDEAIIQIDKSSDFKKEILEIKKEKTRNYLIAKRKKFMKEHMPLQDGKAYARVVETIYKITK